jgi:hypothetical protein
VVVRLGALVSEHPLYPEVVALTRRAEQSPQANLKPVTDFMTSPLGRVLSAPPEPLTAGEPLIAAWETEADEALAQELAKTAELLASWPAPEEFERTGRESRQIGDEVRTFANDLALSIARTEMAAIEERKGELAELRQKATSKDAEEAARAVEREAEIWRQIRAEVEAVRREVDESLAEKRQEAERRLQAAAGAMRVSAQGGRETHLKELRESGAPIRAAQKAAVAAATRPVAPAADLTATPPAPNVDQFAALLRDIDREQRLAWQRRRARLAAARDQLLARVVQNTRNAVRAVAAQTGTTVRFSAPPGESLSDATESFRSSLRSYWSAQPIIPSSEVATSRR